MSPGTLPAPGCPRARTARAAMLAFLAALLAGAAAAERVRVEPQIGPYRPHKVEFHPTERFLLLVVEGDGKVGLWDVEDKERYVRLLTIYTNAEDACFSADGEAIVAGGRDGRVRLWDRDGVQVWETDDAHDGVVTDVAASSDVLASSGDDGTVRLWNLDGSARGEPLRDHDASRLPSFVGAYVAGGEVDPVVKALGAFGRGEPIRPLFARLAIEQLREDGELPSTFVGLVDRYLRRLRPPGFREAGFLRAARKAAEASVEDALAPRAVGEDYLCGFLANEQVAFSDDDGDPLTPQRVVDHLVRCGLLERVKELGTNRVRFVADPIAELLYAKSFVDRGGSQLQELRRRLARGGEDVGGLREALEQVEAS